MAKRGASITPENSNRENSQINEDKESVSGDEYNIFYVYKANNRFNKLFGLQKITYDGKTVKPVGFIAKTYALIIVSLVIVHSYFLIIDLLSRVRVRDIVKVIDILSNICVTIAACVSILISAFLVPPFMVRALQGFAPIDEKLDIHSKNTYIRLRRKVMMAQILLVLISICHLVYEYEMAIEQWSSKYRAFTMHLIDFATYVQILDFSIVIWIVVTRFKTFNSQLAELTKNDESELNEVNSAIIFPIISDAVPDYLTATKTRIQTNFNEKNKSENLMRLMKVFDELADVANILSSCYGLSILFSSTMTFLYIISTVNGLIMFDELIREDSNHTRVYVISWCIMDAIYLILSAFISDTLKNEVEKTNCYIDKLSINTEHGTENSELIENFVQLLSVREVFVTASNFFPYDMTFVLSMIGAIATYTVLLMQVKPMKYPSNNSTLLNNLTQNNSLG